MELRPDILVLGGGGRAGDAWMTGVLAGIEDASGFALSGCDYFVGTSAGAVVASRLAAGEELRRPALDAAEELRRPALDEAAEELRRPASEMAEELRRPALDEAAAGSPDQARRPSAFTDWALALGGPVAAVGMRVTSAPTAAARALGLRLLPAGREPIGWPVSEQPTSGSFEASDRAGSAGDAAVPLDAWDGRLRVVTVERRSGRRVVFGSPGAPNATVSQAVRASCSVPIMFGPTVIGGREYVDGGVWSLTNADVAPATRGAQLLLLAPTASLYGPLNPVLRAASRAAYLVEASVLSGRGVSVRAVTPDRAAAAAIGRALMSGEGRATILAAGYRQGLAL